MDCLLSILAMLGVVAILDPVARWALRRNVTERIPPRRAGAASETNANTGTSR
jgi:hypothetical protein